MRRNARFSGIGSFVVRACVVAAGVGGIGGTWAGAAPVVVPLGSNYDWAYAGFPSDNLRTGAGPTGLAGRGYAFPGILPVALTPGGQHDAVSYLKFDLSGVSLDEGDRAVLNLYSSGGAAVYLRGVDVSPALPAVSIAVTPLPAGQAFVSGATTYLNQPVFDDTGSPTIVVNDVGRWYTLDITSVVDGWLSGAPNNGLALTRVLSPGQSADLLLPTFSAGGNTTAFLSVQSVPEAGSVGVLFAAGAGVCFRRRRG